MKSTTFDWRSGTVTHWDLESFDETRPLSVQATLLKEDLAQVAFNPDILLDIGWYPSFDPDGEFVVTVVSGGDWDNPRYRQSAREIAALRRQIDAAVQIAVSSQGGAK